jgi:hypothetical protein
MNDTRNSAICIRNTGYEGSLELRKIYEILEDERAARDGYLRVVDEEEEDYLYPASWFVAIHLPHDVEEALLAAREA